MNNVKFYVCKKCGNVTALFLDKGGKLNCCGENMHELAPNTVEASQEKHIPVVEKNGNRIKVKVGSIAHPMTAEHLIDFLYVATEHGGQHALLGSNDPPEAEFSLEGTKAKEVYAYCNLHGMWKIDV
ncbi:MAG: desulfoferrodoxin [Treponema sp.]|nr:desulfoferrodoxin [Treponema sp.]